MPGARIAGHTNHRGRGIKILGKSDLALIIGFQVSGVVCHLFSDT
jgi:hypothetical protein